METINMQCKTISQIHLFMLKVVCLVEVLIRTNLVEIHAEMSELLDKPSVCI